jgi:hypothetical protein
MNPQAYYASSSVMKEKGFITLTPGFTRGEGTCRHVFSTAALRNETWLSKCKEAPLKNKKAEYLLGIWVSIHKIPYYPYYC